MTGLSTAELRTLHQLVESSRSAAASEPLAHLSEKLVRLIAEQSAVRQLGPLVFEWRLPLSIDRIATKGKHAGKAITFVLAPHLNAYARLEPWQRARLAKELDLRIMAEMHKWPQWRHGDRARAIRVTRSSSHEPDEVGSCDGLGAKMPTDRMVHAGILRGDTQADLEREARWERASPGKGSLLIEVFDLV